MFKHVLHYSGYLVFGLVAVVALAATLIPLLPSKKWYVQIFDYPRLQTFFIALIALAWYLVFYFRQGVRGYLLVAMFLAVIVVQACKAWPYTRLGANQVLWSDGKKGDSAAISLLISNVLQTNTDYQAVVNKVNEYKPDIFITTETDSTWQQALSTLESQFPYRVPVPQDNTYGMHLYSRFPLRQSQVRFLVEPDIPSIRTGVQLASGEWITLFVVHPRPPVPMEAPTSKERDAEIIMIAKESRKEKGGVIVAGDFNDVAWSETTALFQEVSGFLDPRRGRGFYNTFHAKVPVFRWPLDHIFHSQHFKLAALERVGSVNSDHFPMYVKLSHEPEEKAEQPKVKPEPDTEKKAKETIQEGKEEVQKKKSEGKE